MTNAEARFSNSLRPRKPEGSLGRTAQDGHLDSHTAPELCMGHAICTCYIVHEGCQLLEGVSITVSAKRTDGDGPWFPLLCKVCCPLSQCPPSQA